jgi:hypothetical protein
LNFNKNSYLGSQGWQEEPPGKENAWTKPQSLGCQDSIGDSKCMVPLKLQDTRGSQDWKPGHFGPRAETDHLGPNFVNIFNSTFPSPVSLFSCRKK